MKKLKEIFWKYFVEKKWGWNLFGGFQIPKEGDKLGETLFGMINLIRFLGGMVVVLFFIGLFLNFLLEDEIANILWKVIIYGGLIIWIGGGILGLPITIIYCIRYKSWKYAILTSVAFLIFLYVGYYILTQPPWG